jgi:hypothetical protein
VCVHSGCIFGLTNVGCLLPCCVQVHLAGEVHRRHHLAGIAQAVKQRAESPVLLPAAAAPPAAPGHVKKASRGAEQGGGAVVAQGVLAVGAWGTHSVEADVAGLVRLLVAARVAGACGHPFISLQVGVLPCIYVYVSMRWLTTVVAICNYLLS